MRNQHGGVVLVDETIFGFSEANRGVWMAQDLESGRVLWQERTRPNRSGAICYADGRLYCYNETDGQVNLIEASTRGWFPHGTLKLPQESDLDRDNGAIWTHPVIAKQKLFLRDQEKIYAFDIAGD